METPVQSVKDEGTHTDKCLQFVSHYSIHQKLGVGRTLTNRFETLAWPNRATKEEDKHLKGV